MKRYWMYGSRGSTTNTRDMLFNKKTLRISKVPIVLVSSKDAASQNCPIHSARSVADAGRNYMNKTTVSQANIR